MNSQQYFKEYESKLQLEALLKSLLAGATVGMGVGSLTALITWFFGVMGVWLPITVTFVLLLGAAAGFYFWRFRPTTLDKARRLDKLGLHERLITMVEYENDNSFMAAVQREDAAAHLNQINTNSLKLQLPLPLIISSAATFLCNVAATTLSVLAFMGVISSGQDFFEELAPEEPEITLSVDYEAEEGGYIEGEAAQLVKKGDNALPVLAIAEDGFVFIEWSDGLTDPYRLDENIVEALEVFAIFEPEGAEGDDEGEPGEGEGDGDMEVPSEEEAGEGEPSEPSEEDGDPSDESQESDQGKYGEANQIYNNETYYKELAEQYKDDLLSFLEENKDKLTPEEIEIIKSYIDGV